MQALVRIGNPNASAKCKRAPCLSYRRRFLFCRCGWSWRLEGLAGAGMCLSISQHHYDLLTSLSSCPRRRRSGGWNLPSPILVFSCRVRRERGPCTLSVDLRACGGGRRRNPGATRMESWCDMLIWPDGKDRLRWFGRQGPSREKQRQHVLAACGGYGPADAKARMVGVVHWNPVKSPPASAHPRCGKNVWSGKARREVQALLPSILPKPSKMMRE
jgi:hypothetical protein